MLATELLQGIVEQFNTRLRRWQAASRCTANFAWGYRDGSQRVKQLLLTEIDRPVYRSPPPSGESLEEIVERHRLGLQGPETGP